MMPSHLVTEEQIARETVKAITTAESKLDAEIERLDNLTDSDFAELRRKRVAVRGSRPLTLFCGGRIVCWAHRLARGHAGMGTGPGAVLSRRAAPLADSRSAARRP
jgi:hypothetical protein